MLVSFIIPTCREYEQYSKYTVESIYNSCDFEYEILYSSKTFPRELQNKARWIDEPINNEGAVLPINNAFKSAKGKYVSLLNDDFHIDSSFINIINYLESHSDNDINIEGLCAINWIRHQDPKHILGPQGFLPTSMLCFPVVQKDTWVKNVSENLFCTLFSHAYVDQYMTYYLYAKHNYTVNIVRDAIIYDNPNSSSRQEFYHKDLHTYNHLVSLQSNELPY